MFRRKHVINIFVYIITIYHDHLLPNKRNGQWLKRVGEFNNVAILLLSVTVSCNQIYRYIL